MEKDVKISKVRCEPINFRGINGKEGILAKIR